MPNSKNNPANWAAKSCTFDGCPLVSTLVGNACWAKTLRCICCLVLLSLAPAASWGQAPASTLLTGKVVGTQQHAAEFAAIILLRATDSVHVVQATATDTLGTFALSGVSPGQYVVKVQALGYQPTRTVQFEVLPGAAILPLGTLSLVASSRNLSEVVVTGERPMAERSLGKLTLNVSNSFFKTATTALEVLRRAPGVRVDPLGGITLNGSVTPVVYVEGRQLPLTAEELQGLATEDIDQIEIMSNASARYDGETRAVINIRLKRDKTLGFKGSAYAGASVNRKYGGYDAGASSTYKTKKWAYYGRVGFSEINNFLQNTSLRIVQDPLGGRTEITGNTFIHTRPQPFSYQAVADYLLAKNQTISLLVKGLVRPERDLTTNTTGLSSFTSTGAPGLIYQLPSSTLSDATLNSAAVDLSYRGVLNARGDELQAYADYAYYNTTQDQDFRTFFPTPASNQLRFPSVLRGQFPATTHIGSLRTDYTHVLGAVKLSLGTKLSHTVTDNELRYDTAAVAMPGVYLPDASRSNRFLYDETIVAGYGGLTAERGPNSIDAVLRVEYTKSTGNSITTSSIVNRNYYRWLPSIQAQHKFDKQNTLAITFARKMRRPSFYDLNPFQFYISPYEYNEGNPFLLPSTVTSTELRYSYKDITLTATYELKRDQIAQLPIQNEQTKIIYYTRTNLDEVRNIDLTATAPIVLKKWWRMQHTLVLYHTQTTSAFDGSTINIGAWSLFANGQQTFTLPGRTTLDLSYNYSGPSAGQIYHTKSSGTVNLSLQRAFYQDKVNIQLYAADLFNTYREAFYGQYNGIDVNTLQTRNVQQLTVRFTYRFGNSTFNRTSRASGSAEEEGRANH